MFRAIVVLAGGLMLSQAAPLTAQDVLNQAYGLGVHAYFACDYTRAFEQLTAAIDGGSKDPRAYYFRGFTYLKLGRPTEAATDFRKGAELESKDVNNFFNVGKSLERVQGSARLEVERYRTSARMAAYEQAERLRKARYEALQREESRVLREQSQGVQRQPVEAVPAPPAPGEDTNPFAAPEDKAKPNAKSSDETDPFSAPAEQPKADKKKSGVIGSIGRAIGKGITGEDKKAANKAKPAEKKPEADDPFAETPEKKPAEKKPAEKKPADKKPAEKKPPEKKPDVDDPFAS